MCEYVCVCVGGGGVDSQCLGSAGADVGRKEVNFYPTGSNQVISTAQGRAFVVTGTDIQRKEVKLDPTGSNLTNIKKRSLPHPWDNNN